MKNLLRTALIVAVCFSAAGVQTARADPLEDGKAAYDRGDYAAGYKLLLPLAERGNPSAQYMLGAMYNSGVPGTSKGQDVREAAKWFRKAAEANDTGAQIMLGIMYFSGRGVLQDYVLAHMWFNIAATSGAPDPGLFRDVIAEQKMTPTQIAEAQRLARKWLQQHRQASQQ